MYNTPVYFNNFNLSSLQGVRIYNHDFSNMPSRELKSNKIARADKSILTSAEYKDKPVYIYGGVGGATKQEIDQNFDRLKGVVQVNEGVLMIEQGGENVEYTGTLQGIEKQYFGKTLKFTLTFLCSNPIGAATATDTLLNVTNTLVTNTWLLNIEGSFKAEPYFTITITSGSGFTTKTISLLNGANGQGIRVTRTWSAGDVLVVDSANRVLTVNAVAVDYQGTFPSFFPGARSFQYIDDFTTRNVSINITYNKQYA